MDWNIQTFLARARSFLSKGEQAKHAVQKGFFEVFKVELHNNDVRIRDTVAYISVPSVLRSEVVLKKEAVLKAISRHGGSITDIR